MKYRLCKLSHEIAANESGTALVLLTVFIVALFGFAALSLDVGCVYQEQRHIQIAADAAALAGATLLTNQNQNVGLIRKEAKAIAGANGVKPNEIAASSSGDIQVGLWTNGTFSANTTGPEGRYNAVQVPARRKVNLMFARVVGMNFMNPAVDSVAIVDSVRCPWAASPLGITSNALADATIGSTFIVGEKVGSAGQWGALNFEGRTHTSGEWEAAMLNGYTGAVCAATSVPTETDPGANDVKQVMEKLLASGQTIIVPVVNDLDLAGATAVETFGFVGLQVVGLSVQGGSKMQITFKLVSVMTSGPGGGPTGPIFAQTRGLVR